MSQVNSYNLIEAIKTLLTVGLSWLVIMGYWPLTPDKQAITLSFGIAFINVIAFAFQNSKVTSLGNPKAADGEPLVRASQSPISPASKDPQYRG